MRCDCCNKNLNDYESTLRHAVTGQYLNTCRKCLDGLGIPAMGNTDFEPTASIEDDPDFSDWSDDFDDEETE